MKKRFIRKNEPVETTAWLTTFNDVITLLMVFFVLMFSVSSIDTKKIKNFQNSLQSGLGVLNEGKKTSVRVVEAINNKETLNNTNILDKNINSLARKAKEDELKAKYIKINETDKKIEKVSKAVEEYIRNLNAESGIGVALNKNGALITLEDSLLFKVGVAEIEPGGFEVLDKVIKGVDRIASHIRIEGHTDNLSIKTEEFPSNWELSTARAVNVLKYFIYKGNIPAKIVSAVGYGASKPVCNNLTTENRAQNRRVEIVLETGNINLKSLIKEN